MEKESVGDLGKNKSPFETFNAKERYWFLLWDIKMYVNMQV